MKTNIEIKLYIDKEVIEETGFSENKIKEFIMSYSFSELKINDFNILTLDSGYQIKVLPFWNIYNDLVFSVSYL